METEFPHLTKKAVKVFIPFTSTHLCGCGFSALTMIKSKYRSRLWGEDDLRLFLSTAHPRFNRLCALKTQTHCSHQNRGEQNKVSRFAIGLLLYWGFTHDVETVIWKAVLPMVRRYDKSVWLTLICSLVFLIWFEEFSYWNGEIIQVLMWDNIGWVNMCLKNQLKSSIVFFFFKWRCFFLQKYV